MDEIKDEVKLIRYKETVKKQAFEFGLIPVKYLHLSEYQRELSSSLVKSLGESMSLLGFITPLVTVKISDTRYEVVDGQHRFEAAKRLGTEKLVCIVIPLTLKEFILKFNVEKPSDIKVKCKQIYKVYSFWNDKEPLKLENEFVDFFEKPYFLTFGYLLEEVAEGKKIPLSLYESFVSKIDTVFFDKPLSESKEIRLSMASLFYAFHVKFSDFAREYSNYTERQTIFSKLVQSVYGARTKSIGDSFEVAISKLEEAMKNLEAISLLEGEVKSNSQNGNNLVSDEIEGLPSVTKIRPLSSAVESKVEAVSETFDLDKLLQEDKDFL